MKRLFGLSYGIIFMAFVLISASTAFATGGGYTPGLEGAMAPSLPPPGFYYKQYNLLLDSDTLNNPDGDKLDVDFDLNVMVQAHRLAYFFKNPLFSGDWGITVTIPVVATDLSIGAAGIDDSEIGLGDIFFEPIVWSWHKKRADLALGFGVGMPNGDFDPDEPASPGTGKWFGMMTAGVTYYFDEAKTWTVSALTRTLTYGKQDKTDITSGEEFVVDWGIAKEFPVTDKVLVRPAIVGSGYWQIGEDEGPGATDDKGEAYSLGAEINLFWLPRLTQFNFRYLQDFDTKDEAETNKFLLSIIHAF